MDSSSFQLHRINLDSLNSDPYDLALCALGYESRATAMFKRKQPRATRVVALGFDFGNCLSYDSNLQYFKRSKYEVIENIPDITFEEICEDVLESSIPKTSTNERFRVLIDISCFNRYRLATLISLIAKFSRNRTIEIDFYYTVAKYEEPNHNYIPNTVVNPVHPAFAGWSSTPANPTAAIVGLGYEQDQALGIVEYLQANPVWLFSPSSGEKKYRPAVASSNELLLEELPESHVITYHVEEPLDTFNLLDGMIRGLQHDHTVVTVPFGPKIFVLCSLLAGWRHRSSAVWRVSAGTRIEPTDRRASEHQCVLRVIAMPPDSASTHLRPSSIPLSSSSD